MAGQIAKRKGWDWDDIEFDIRKDITGYTFHIGQTPQSAWSRLQWSDAVLAVVVVGVLAVAIRRR